MSKERELLRKIIQLQMPGSTVGLTDDDMNLLGEITTEALGGNQPRPVGCINYEKGECEDGDNEEGGTQDPSS